MGEVSFNAFYDNTKTYGMAQQKDDILYFLFEKKQSLSDNKLVCYGTKLMVKLTVTMRVVPRSQPMLL